ncbi:Thaumatin-like protein [Vitis vinifera]|uniref:Thaumatin-like protein n=1 Tax=Vitis vinifera TaxID=29760 RepID=A0A438EG51_VITVI|nr:Thaumatin-like protein [Vitis vinifera]
MGLFKSLSISSLLLITLFFTSAHAAIFNIQNRCSYTVWAAAVPGGGRRLDPRQSWSSTVNPGTTGARIWARTGCSFDGAGRGRCQTGDCGGVLECTAYGAPPNTLAEFALNQFNNLDFFDISLVDGFNVPMAFSPTSNGCSRGIRCTANIVGQCPSQLRAQGGCNNPCTVFKTDQYCCNSGAVALQITQGISRLGALMLTATLRMIKPAPLHALVVPTMMLSSAHKASINYSMHVLASLNY